MFFRAEKSATISYETGEGYLRTLMNCIILRYEENRDKVEVKINPQAYTYLINAFKNIAKKFLNEFNQLDVKTIEIIRKQTFIAAQERIIQLLMDSQLTYYKKDKFLNINQGINLKSYEEILFSHSTFIKNIIKEFNDNSSEDEKFKQLIYQFHNEYVKSKEQHFFEFLTNIIHSQEQASKLIFLIKFYNIPAYYLSIEKYFEFQWYDLLLQLIQNNFLDVNNRLGNNGLIIHGACLNDLAKSLLQELIEKGANLNAGNCVNNTSLHLAVEHQTRECIMLLLESKRCSPNLRNVHGLTPLHIAIKNGDVETINLLAKYNHIALLADYEGNTPLDYVKQSSFEAVEKSRIESLFYGCKQQLFTELSTFPSLPSDHDFKKNLILFNLPSELFWHFYIDKNRTCESFEETEKGYCSGMQNAFYFMQEQLAKNEPLNSKLIIALHDIAIDNVEYIHNDVSAKNRKDRFSKKGLAQVKRLIIFDSHRCVSLEGLKEISNYSDLVTIEDPSYSKLDRTHFDVDKVFNDLKFYKCKYKVIFNLTKPTELLFFMDGIVNEYHDMLSKSENFLLALTVLIRRLELVHPFEDGNLRTMAFCVANLEAARYGYPPLLWDNPNFFDGLFSITELYHLLETAMRKGLAFVENYMASKKLVPFVVTEKTQLTLTPSLFFSPLLPQPTSRKIQLDSEHILTSPTNMFNKQ